MVCKMKAKQIDNTDHNLYVRTVPVVTFESVRQAMSWSNDASSASKVLLMPV